MLYPKARNTRKKEGNMAIWKNGNNDTISTDGTKYTITRNGVAITTDISKWHHSAELWIKNEIASGYYTEFLLAGREG
jgi:hypothetical protein